jgi:hypothetical protein
MITRWPPHVTTTRRTRSTMTTPTSAEVKNQAQGCTTCDPEVPREGGEWMPRAHGLNGGIPATQVAEWAGHSVEIPLKIYAKCLDGGQEHLRARVQAALGH